MKKIFSVLFFLISSSFIFSQINYYVDGINGNDGNNGTSVASAFKTIYKARDAIRTVNGRDRKSTRLNSSHIQKSRMPSSA